MKPGGRVGGPRRKALTFERLQVSLTGHWHSVESVAIRIAKPGPRPGLPVFKGQSQARYFSMYTATSWSKDDPNVNSCV